MYCQGTPMQYTSVFGLLQRLARSMLWLTIESWQMRFSKAVNQGHASLVPQNPTFFLFLCLHSKNEIVKNYITTMPIKTVNAMRFCWKNIKYVTITNSIARHGISSHMAGYCCFWSFISHLLGAFLRYYKLWMRKFI